jgi:hypothetical protein
MKTTTTARRLEIASRKLIKAYASTNTSLSYRIDAEENFLAAERKHTSKPASGMLHHRAKAYLAGKPTL